MPIHGITASARPGLPIVTGGTLYSDSTYYYRVFRSSGTLTVSQAPIQMTFVIIAGGGGGANAQALASPENYLVGGGGGAGGAGEVTQNFEVGNHNVIIGAGGSSATVGGNTQFGGYLMIGGGSFQTNGGSGQGDSGWYNPALGGYINPPAGAGLFTQGSRGGTAFNGVYSGTGTAGGGGGSGYPFANADGTGFGASTGVNGGSGAVGWSSWHAVTGTGVVNPQNATDYRIAAGGGGPGGIGGNGAGGGAGNGTQNALAPFEIGKSAVANTGSGGGGVATNSGTGQNGGNGGSGLVMVRYLRSAVGG